MGSKYKIGDRVIVVHRLPADHYYSYILNGSAGTVDEITEEFGGYTYHLAYDDLVVADPNNCYDNTPALAWYKECCLDPAPSADSIGLEDFESVLG